MTTPECHELAVLVSLHAAGALDAAEAARVTAHLDACAACREAERAERELLGLARLPEPSNAETLALADLPARTLGALRRREGRRTWTRRSAAAVAVVTAAAAALVMLLSPAIVRPPLPAGQGGAEPAATQVAWQSPDPDTLWSEAADLDWDRSASSSSSSVTDATLAAYDAGAGE